jgi:CII-binding regulator of phage lambda lysogenization HflD
MRKIDLMVKAKLHKKGKAYQKQLEKTRSSIAKLREKLTKERNCEQYLKRCIAAINTELGHQKAG